MNYDDEEYLPIKEETKKYTRRNIYSLLNICAQEYIVFKRLKNGDKAPIEQFLKDLGHEGFAEFIEEDKIDTDYIKKGFITFTDYNSVLKEFYRDKSSFIACYAVTTSIGPVIKNEMEMPIEKGTPVFYGIMDTEVELDINTFTPDEPVKQNQRNNVFYETRFITAIVTKGLQVERCVNRYVKDITYMPPFMMRLLEKKKDRYYLINNDPSTLDYTLAMLSSFLIYSEYNAKLFELKMKRWEEHNKYLF